MKVLLINTYDKGGAANACLRLQQGLSKKGVDSKVLLKKNQKPITKSNNYQKFKHKITKLLRLLKLIKSSTVSIERQFINERSNNLELFTFPHSNYDVTTSPLYQKADIINLHWVAHFLDYESFFRKNTKPVVWTLHDMNPFTGGEHYLETFLGMSDSGFPVTRDFSEKELLFSKQNLVLKQKALTNVNNLHIVTLCNWMSKQVSNSLFKKYPIHLISNGIDSEVFQPRDKDYSRTILNIPRDKIVVLFVADSITNHRKGYSYLKKALSIMDSNDVVLCAVGSKKSHLESTKNTIELGAINDQRLMSMAYSAADVFVIPSLMDNLPNTVLESVMCGTPVIGFPIGGIPDIVKHGFNGLMTSDVNSESLQKTIELFLNTMPGFDRNEIRMDALSKYDILVQAEKYIELYQSILNP